LTGIQLLLEVIACAKGALAGTCDDEYALFRISRECVDELTHREMTWGIERIHGLCTINGEDSYALVPLYLEQLAHIFSCDGPHQPASLSRNNPITNISMSSKDNADLPFLSGSPAPCRQVSPLRRLWDSRRHRARHQPPRGRPHRPLTWAVPSRT